MVCGSRGVFFGVHIAINLGNVIGEGARGYAGVQRKTGEYWPQ